MILYVQEHYPAGYCEKLLLASILRRAVYDIVLYKTSKRLVLQRRYQDAKRWMFENDMTHMPHEDRFTSFLSICSLLDQDPADIRKKTLNLRREDIRKIEYGRL
jgi:hypothetical protein